MVKKIKILVSILITSLFLVSCNHKDKDDEDTKDANIHVKTPVTVTNISKDKISEFITLNANSSYLKKNNLKSTATGYIKSVETAIGQNVRTGQVLFTLQ